jgi:hypothetical protein
VLPLPSVIQRRELLLIDQADRSAGRCVGSASALGVCSEAFIEVRGGADIQRIIAALEDVDPSHSTTMPSSAVTAIKIFSESWPSGW